MKNTYIKMSRNNSARLKRSNKAHLLISVVATVFLFMNCYVSLQNALFAESRLQIVTGENEQREEVGYGDFRIYVEKKMIPRLKWNFPMTRVCPSSVGLSCIPKRAGSFNSMLLSEHVFFLKLVFVLNE